MITNDRNTLGYAASGYLVQGTIAVDSRALSLSIQGLIGGPLHLIAHPHGPQGARQSGLAWRTRRLPFDATARINAAARLIKHP